MPSDGWFRKKSRFSQVPAKTAAEVPEGVATKCGSCGRVIFTREFEKNFKVCADCGHHHRLTAEERIAYTVDTDSFVPLWDDLRSVDPLQFPDYSAKIEKSRGVTGLEDGFRTGLADVGGIPVVIGVTDFRFIGGSLGSVAGEKILRAMEEGARLNRPVVLFTASGGARMFEGLLALMQMAKTSAAAARLAEAGIPYISVLTDPTTGGVLASYAMLGDIILAEPGALVGFAGARVAAQVSVQKPPDGYQTAEWQLSRGQVDQVVARRDLPVALSSILSLLGFVSRPAEETPAALPSEVSVG